VHQVGFIIRIYHDARSHECKILASCLCSVSIPIQTADKVQYPIKMCCFTAHHSISLILSSNVSLRLIYEYHIYSHFDMCNRVIDMNFQNSQTKHEES
jgi:hypothetical protein